MRALPLLLAVPILAGCVSPGDLVASLADRGAPNAAAVADLLWAERALPFGTAHNHTNPLEHRDLSTPNFEVVSWNALETAYHKGTTGGYSCGEGRTVHGRTIAYVNSFTTDVAFVGVDVTDPADPKKVSELALPAVQVYDLTVTPDGRFVVLGTSSLYRSSMGRDPPRNVTLPALAAEVLAPPAPPPPRCGASPAEAPEGQAIEDPTPYAAGVVLVDVGDPANPRVVDYFPQPNYGVHSIFATEVDGRTLVLASNVNGVTTFGLSPVSPPVGSLHAASYFTFFEIVDGKLAFRSVYRPPPSQPLREPIRNGHLDGTIHKHPVTGQALAYLADWDGGLSIVDVTAIDRPTLLARWTDYRFGDDRGDGGNVHQAIPLATLWDGRHYTILGQETSSRPRYSPTGLLHILDTTDPAAPTWVSSWTLPVDLQWTSHLLFSLHYYAVQDRTLFVTAYHAGVWAVDLANVAEPRTRGVFIPSNLPPAPAPWIASEYAPSTLEVLLLPGGEILVFDETSGAYVLRYHPEKAPAYVPEWNLLPPDTA